MPVFATSVIFGVYAVPAFSGIFHRNLPVGQYLSQRVVSGLPGAKVHRCTKHSSDPSQMYNITTIDLPTTVPVHLNR